MRRTLTHHVPDHAEPRPIGAQGLRRRGARESKSMGQVASEVLARALAEADPAPGDFEWISRDLGRPMIDLDDDEAVRAELGEQL